MRSPVAVERRGQRLVDPRASMQRGPLVSKRGASRRARAWPPTSWSRPPRPSVGASTTASTPRIASAAACGRRGSAVLSPSGPCADRGDRPCRAGGRRRRSWPMPSTFDGRSSRGSDCADEPVARARCAAAAGRAAEPRRRFGRQLAEAEPLARRGRRSRRRCRRPASRRPSARAAALHSSTRAAAPASRRRLSNARIELEPPVSISASRVAIRAPPSADARQQSGSAASTSSSASRRLA